LQSTLSLGSIVAAVVRTARMVYVLGRSTRGAAMMLSCACAAVFRFFLAELKALSLGLYAIPGLLVLSIAAHGDALDGVPVEVRAQLAVAASAFSVAEAPALDPDSPNFAPNTVASYLETNQDGNYSASTVRNGLQVDYTLLRHASEREAATALEAWKATGDATIPLDWGGSFPAFRRGQGLLGISMLDASIVARGQSGPWHFEISVTPQDDSSPGSEAGPKELGAAAEAMRALAANATRYRVFPRELRIEIEVAGSSRHLAPGERFQIPLQADAETMASFKLQVLDGGKPVRGIRYQAHLSGALSSLAELEDGGTMRRATSIDASSPDGEAVALKWRFPPATSKELAPLLDKGDLSLALSVEARTPPEVLP
jgi:hypothetical protein